MGRSIASTQRLAKQCSYLAWYEPLASFINLAGDYDYLESAYYESQRCEAEGIAVVPTCKDMIDAYVPPIFLEKARHAGIAVPSSYISNGFFEPPVIIDPINPFMIKSRIVWKNGADESIAKSMTRNFTYAICCQEIPPGARIRYFRSVLGWCANKQLREASQLVWREFHIPLARVRVIELPEGVFLLSDISPLVFDRLSARELDYLEGRVIWEK
jgi:hypothetical protein